MTSGERGATAILKTRGLTEPGQARRLRRASAKLEGIVRVDINYILGSVTVEYDADKLTSAQVKKMLASSIHASVARQADHSEGSKVE
jgi:copper chaperone CopZ